MRIKQIIISITLLLAATQVALAQGVLFENLTLKAALAKAKETGKQVFVDCYTKTCGPCKFMVREIFPQKVCGDYFNPRFVSVMKDMQEGEGLDIAKRYEVMIYPTYLVLNPDGTLVYKFEGGAMKDATKFVEKIKEGVK